MNFQISQYQDVHFMSDLVKNNPINNNMPPDEELQK